LQFLLLFTTLLSAIMLSAILRFVLMLSAINAECHYEEFYFD
jgi:hypothetical protein